MRRCVVLIALALLTLGIAAFADEKPAMDLPVYGGGEVTMEINMGNEDILPMVNAMLPLLSGKLGKMADKVNVDALVAALKDVKRIEMLQVDVAKSKVTESDIISFYAKNLPSGKWSRVFWQSLPKSGTVALYSDGEGLYGFRVQSTTVDSKPVKRAQIIKTQGKIDFVKLLEMAGKLIAG